MTHSTAKNLRTQTIEAASAKQDNVKFLPSDRVQALNTLIKATQALIAMADKETQALAQNDIVTFHILQDEKEFLSGRYEKLSVEFRERLQEFRGADRGLLDRLEKMQNLLGEKTDSNNQVVMQIRDRAQNKTQSSLLTVQEMAQQRPVKMPVDENTHVNGNKDA
jgi:hypothetical protein